MLYTVQSESSLTLSARSTGRSTGRYVFRGNFMRTATLFFLSATLTLFAAPQDPAKASPETAPKSGVPQAAPPKFEAVPPTVSSGQTAQLTWSVEGATSVS